MSNDFWIVIGFLATGLSLCGAYARIYWLEKTLNKLAKATAKLSTACVAMSQRILENEKNELR